MDPRLWIARLHDNDDVPSLDIDLAAQNYPDGPCWTDAYGKEANMFTPGSDPQFQYNAGQVDMGVAHGNPLGMTPDHDLCCVVAYADRSRTLSVNRSRSPTTVQ
jgi:hypothetical protein